MISGQRHVLVWLCLFVQLMNTQLSPDKNLIWSLRNPLRTNTGCAYVPTDPALILNTNVTVRHLGITINNQATTIHSVTTDFHANNVYFSAVESGAFSEYTIGASALRVIHYGLGSLRQMTMDWTTKNLYWVDSLFRWIAVKSVRTSDIFDFKVLIEADVDLPLGIGVDPTRGYLFWTESGQTQSVKRAGLDGDSPSVIAVGGLLRPRALTIDIQSGRIYWVDTAKETVEYCNNDGQQRKVLRKLNGLIFAGIAYYKNLLFVSDEAGNQVLALRSGTGVSPKVIPSPDGTPKMVAVFAEENQPSLPDGCANRNCEHFCVKTANSTRCLCQEGFTLSQDGRSCTGSIVYGARLLTFANDTHVCFLNITITQPNVQGSVFCPVTNGRSITAIAPDSARWMVYYADRGRRLIARVSLKTGIISTVITNTGTVEGLDYDWVNDVIYWTDSETKRIRSYGFLVGSFGVTTNSTLGRLTVDPFSRQLFWITRSPFSIRSVSYDKPGDVKTLISTGMRDPSDIHCDPIRKMLFWTDGLEIKSMYINGTGAQTVISALDDNNRGLVVHKNFIFWSSHETSALINSGDLYKKIHSHRATVPGNGHLVDVDILDRFSQQSTPGVCFENGGCDHYCLPTEGSRVCQCELGFELQTDRKTCRTDSLTGEHILLTDFTGRRFYQVDINTGNVRAAFAPSGGSPTIAINGNYSRLYWSDFGRKEIKSSYLNGSSVTTVKSTGLELADRLAVDEVTGNIFYSAFNPRMTNHSVNYIAVISENGKSTKRLVPGLNVPRAVALHTSKGILFWSDHGFGAHIGRINMDGSERQKIVTTDIKFPNGIAIDLQEDRMFWTDGSRDVIERCTLYGADRLVLLRDVNAHLMSLVIHGDKLYYTAWNRAGITVVNKADGSNKQLLVESPKFAELADFVIVRTNQQSSVKNLCTVNNGGCSSLCLPTPTGRSCACADRVSLQDDGRTCVGEGTVATDSPVRTSTHAPDPVTTPVNTTVIIIASITSGTIVIVAFCILITVFLFRKRKRRNTERQVNYNASHSPEQSPYYLTPSDGYCSIEACGVAAPVYHSPPSYIETMEGSRQDSMYLTPNYCTMISKESEVDDNYTSLPYGRAPLPPPDSEKC